MHAMNDKKVIYLVQATAALTAVVVDSKCHELSHVVPIVHGTLPITPYGILASTPYTLPRGLTDTLLLRRVTGISVAMYALGAISTTPYSVLLNAQTPRTKTPFASVTKRPWVTSLASHRPAW